MANIKLSIVSQEKKLVETEISQITAPSSEGEITILPGHIPLFTRLVTGLVHYTNTNGDEHNFIVSKGFLTINPENELTIMVDSAVSERDVSAEKAEKALEAAKKTMSDKTATERELLMAEAAMKKAMWEIRLAQQTKRSKR